MLKSNPIPNDFSLVSSAAAPDVQSSLGTLKVTQQLQWTLMGHRGAVFHITGLLPLQSKRFQQSAAAAIWEEGGKIFPLWLERRGGGVYAFLSIHVATGTRESK